MLLKGSHTDYILYDTIFIKFKSRQNQTVLLEFNSSEEDLAGGSGVLVLLKCM